MCAKRSISILLQSKETLHHASMDVNLINLPGRSLNLTSKDTISNKCFDASIIATMMHDNGASGVGTPSVTARSPWTKVMGDILDILILHDRREKEIDTKKMISTMSYINISCGNNETIHSRERTDHVEKSFKCSVWVLLVSL